MNIKFDIILLLFISRSSSENNSYTILMEFSFYTKQHAIYKTNLIH